MVTTLKAFELLDPTVDLQTVYYPISPRVSGLDGKVIGMLDNAKSNFNNLLDDLEVLLRENCPNATIIRRRKPGASTGCPPDTMRELLEKCDAIITGLGD